jgi:hypothetical protein
MDIFGIELCVVHGGLVDVLQGVLQALNLGKSPASSGATSG